MRKNNDQKQNRKRLNSQSTSQKLPPLSKKVPQQEVKNLGPISHQDQGLVGLLSEYFIKNNFLDTLEVFQKDCQKGFKTNNKCIDSFKQEIMQAFEQGMRETFFTRFHQFVPISIRSREVQTMKLEFYFHVYFFIFSIHPQLGKKRQIDTAAKNSYISYLQGRGSTLAKSQEFLQFYALAYLPKPQQHPTFKTIFTKEWIGELKKRLAYFLDKLYPNHKTPAIVSIYDKFIEKNMQRSERSASEMEEQIPIQEQIEAIEDSHAQGKQHLQQSGINENQQSIRSPTVYEADKSDRERQSMAIKIAELEEQKNQLVKFIENVKNKYQSLQNNYQDFTDVAQNTLIDSQTKWFKITQEFYSIANTLLDICTRTQASIQANDQPTLEKITQKLRKYESFINTNIEDLISDNVDFSLFERPDQDLSVDMVRKNTEARYQNLIQLDFKKIKETLQKENTSQEVIEEKCVLLDALKSRLIKTRGIVLKREVVVSIVMNDVLGFKEGSTTIQLLLNGESEVLLVRASQFINALSKDYYGREYLARDQFLTPSVEILKNEKTDETVRMIVLSTLQQLSVRPTGQKNMIENDVIKWIVKKLNTEREVMSAYVMQHTTALLVNLLLRKQGLAKSEEIKEQILQTLINLLEVETTEIRSYVHGALYPLFSKKVFRQKAKEYGIEDNIKYLLENTNVQLFVLQLKYLQKQLKMEEDEPEEQAEDDHDIDEISDEEIGEDFGLEIENAGTNIIGEEFLLRNYSLTGPQAINQLNQIREEVSNIFKKKSVYMANSFYERPSTNNPIVGPSMRRNLSNNNSVYSNRSSNRILKSELNNRSMLGNNNTRNQVREKLDTVQPENSEKELSMKDFVNENDSESVRLSGNSNIVSRKNNHIPSQKGERKKQDSDLFPGFKNQPVLENDSFSQKDKSAVNDFSSRAIKPYQNSQQYRSAFETRAKIVRTPPEK